MNWIKESLHNARPLGNFGQRPRVLKRSKGRLGQTVLRILGIVVALFSSSLSLQRSHLTAENLRHQRIGALVGAQRFDLVRWEFEALADKLLHRSSASAAEQSEEQARQIVVTYLENAARLGDLEADLARLLSRERTTESEQVVALRAELSRLHMLQNKMRPTVEEILQNQVGEEIKRAGLGIGGLLAPPVLFTFVDPPKKLVVSPRYKIATIHSRMLDSTVDPAAALQNEQDIREATGLSAYVTNIGGLGAYPTMVVNRASLPWVISTIAHEWVHNYLTFFPLGIRYGQTPGIITLNETVADIVGDEIGQRVVSRLYPEFAPPDPAPVPSPADGGEILDNPYKSGFDFFAEMAETRRRVDGLLSAGLVDTAEHYMEARRKYFVANGYSLRVLNQAYFAFHGSYATSAASSSPIGPALSTLRYQVDDLATFLRTVRWITDPADLDRILSSYQLPAHAPIE